MHHAGTDLHDRHLRPRVPPVVPGRSSDPATRVSSAFAWIAVVPLLLAGYFFHERQAAAFTFCMFFFFENWLYTATYMADARAMVLPLVTTGDPDHVEHDWNTIFSSLGMLRYDTTVAGITRLLGWGGMLGSVAWLISRLRFTNSQ